MKLSSCSLLKTFFMPNIWMHSRQRKIKSTIKVQFLFDYSKRTSTFLANKYFMEDLIIVFYIKGFDSFFIECLNICWYLWVIVFILPFISKRKSLFWHEWIILLSCCLVVAKGAE